MQINIIHVNGTNLALIESDQLIIGDMQDALDLLASCNYQGASKIIVHAEHIHPDFFDLKTGMAGEVLRKFSTYQTQLAIVGGFSQYTSKSLQAFIFESNKVGRINFVENMQEAQEKLSKAI